MTSVRFLKTQPVLALVLALVLTGGSQASAGPVSSAKSHVAQTVAATQPESAAEEVRVVINIPSRTLWVYEGERIIRHFPVGVGRPGFPTPVGRFSIIRKVLDPGWENPYLSSGQMRLAPGQDNPLGTRWMGFLRDSGGEYGMHGTDNPGSVGKFSSHGCVRLKVPDAEALFEMVDVGTPVEVIYQPVIIRKHGNEIRIAVYADRFRRGMPDPEQIKARIIKEFPQAKVNEAQLRKALSQPLEKYISVGNVVITPKTVVSTEPADNVGEMEDKKPVPVQPVAKPSPALPPFHNLLNGQQL